MPNRRLVYLTQTPELRAAYHNPNALFQKTFERAYLRFVVVA